MYVSGSRRVCVLTGHCYLNGSGVARDEVEALAYFVRASELSYAPAQHQIGSLIFFSLHSARSFLPCIFLHVRVT